MAAATEIHSFYCINCGQHNIDLPRKNGHKYGKHHKKKLWCHVCKKEYNNVECRSSEEVQEFLEKFKAGEYKSELELIP